MSRSASRAAWAAFALLWAATPRAADCAAPPSREANVRRMQEGGPYPSRAFEHDVVTIECDDGYRLAGDYVRRRRAPQKMPGVILLHDAGASRRQWFPVVVHLAGRGCAVLALDLRGFGESPAQTGNPPGGTIPEPVAHLADVREAVSYLAIKGEVDGGRLALVGMGLGADLAVAAAAQPWAEAVRCVVAVSPGSGAAGLAPAEAAGKLGRGRSLYAAAARGDAAGFAAATAMLAAHRGAKELFAAEGEGRGTALFGQGLIPKIPAWILPALTASR